MHPGFAGGVLALLMCFTLPCYFFRIPDDLRKSGKEGFWGVPNAEFNWCEADYELVPWLAEPANSLSNVVYLILPAAFLVLNKPSWEVSVLMALMMMIGLGSVAFHASLRYSMQLLDEIPMLWYSMLLASTCLRRMDVLDPMPMSACFAGVVTVMTLITEQHSFLHQTVRGLMSTAFSAALIVSAWGTTALVNRLYGEARVDKHQRVAAILDNLHAIAFVCFVVAVMCWLLDNYFCPVLRELPYGLPYPHLHVWWHLLTAVALYLIGLVLHVDDKRHSERISFTFRLGLPAVVL